MLKNIRTKIIMVFVIFGIVVTSLISALSLFESMKLEAASSYIEPQFKEQVLEQISISRYQTFAWALAAVGIIIIFGFWISGILVKPFAKLLNTAEVIVNGEESKSKSLKKVPNRRQESEIDKLVNALSTMNNDLKVNLSEVTRQKKQIEIILESITDGIIAFNMAGEVIHINHAAKSLLNVKNTQNFNQIFDKFDMDINMEKIIYLENWAPSDKQLTVKDRYINLFFASFKDEKDRPSGIIVVIQDITESVKLDRTRKEFMANVSHELKTPITTISGSAELLLENEVDDQTQKKFLQSISTAANRMSDLVKDLLELSRYEAAKDTGEKTEFDVAELTKDVFEELKIVMEKKSITGECLVTSTVPNVYADKKGVRRVITNILSNAIKYNKENGSITVYVGCVYNDAYIKVIDTGIGISKEDLGKIFDRFYVVDKSRVRKAEDNMGLSVGTGLGLSIVQEILNKNNGRIDIKSELGKGTEVVIRIPTKKALEKQHTIEE